MRKLRCAGLLSIGDLVAYPAMLPSRNTIKKSYIFHTFSKYSRRSQGFSLLELVATLTILAILAGISIPAFNTFLKGARIDQAKSTLNSAIANCLQTYRTNPDSTSTATIPKERLSSLAETGYVIDGEKNKCSDFMIKPSDPNENYLFPLGFMVRDGKVQKIAIPASDRASEKSCQSWGTCGIPPELQAEWDRLAAIEKAKKDCNENFYTWLRKPSSGSNNRWDESTNTCSLKTWAFEGSIQSSEESYKAAETRKYGLICTEKKNAEQTKKTTAGPLTISECGSRELFFCLGEDKGSLEAMNACVAANQEAKCISDRETARLGGHKGKYGPIPGPGKCGETVWMCNKVMVYSEEEYKNTDCGKVPSCIEPPTAWYCPSRQHLPECKKQCP